MARILITGNSGAGKSTLGKLLSDRLNIPLIHMDTHYWQPNWTRLDENLWRDKVSNLIKGDQWVMEGNFVNTLDLRLPIATHVIHLDFPGLKCLFRCLKRKVLTGKGRRLDLPIGCYEKFDLEFYKFVLEYPRLHSPKVYKMVNKYFNGQFLAIKKDIDINQLLEKIK